MNSVQLVGNLARDPELRTTTSGLLVCSFTVACQRRYKNANGQYDADFISCVAWRETANFVHRYFIKGNKIGVIGTLQTRSYDAQDGSKRYVTEVVVDNVEFVGAAPQSSGLSRGGQPYRADSETHRVSDLAPRSDSQGAPARQQYEQQYASAQQPRQTYNEQMSMSQLPNEDDDDELPF